LASDLLASSQEEQVFRPDIFPLVKQAVGVVLQQRAAAITPEERDKLIRESASRCTITFAKKAYNQFLIQFQEEVAAYQAAKTPAAIEEKTEFLLMRKAAFLGGVANLYGYGFSNSLRRNLIFAADGITPIGVTEAERGRFPSCDRELRAKTGQPEIEYSPESLAQEGQARTRRRRHKQKKNKNKTKARKVKGKKSRR
jgi:hypothetical protein